MRNMWMAMLLAGATALCVQAGPAWAAQPVRVVASTPFFADLVRAVGGERVEVKSVAPAGFNVHFVQPKPSDIRNLRRADLFVFTGLDLEAWADPLVEAAGRPEFFRGGERSLDLSNGVALIEIPKGPLTRAEGDLHLFGNPHYAMDPKNARLFCDAIARKLGEIDPSGRVSYKSRSEDFVQKLDAKIADWERRCAHCAGQEVFAYHQDSEYLTGFLGIRIAGYLEPKPGIPPTPKHLRELEELAAAGKIRAILFGPHHPENEVRAFAKRIGTRPVRIEQNPGRPGGPKDFFELFDANIGAIAGALQLAATGGEEHE